MNTKVRELEEVAKSFEGYIGIVSASPSGVTFAFDRGLTYDEQLKLQEVVTPGDVDNVSTENIRCFTFPGLKAVKTATIVVTF